MIRVHVICEGQTEEMFVNEVLAPAFEARQIFFRPSLIGKPGHKGGNVCFERLYKDVEKRLLGDKQAYCTTLFDYYGLPSNFPGKGETSLKGSMDAKADHLLRELVKALESRLGSEVLRRFVPYVQMYEFEGLLFSCPEGLSRGIYQPALLSAFQRIAESAETPEQINDSPQTAPSKRILALHRAYQKPLDGVLAAVAVGLVAMRARCRRFNQWLDRIEHLPML